MKTVVPANVNTPARHRDAGPEGLRLIVRRPTGEFDTAADPTSISDLIKQAGVFVWLDVRNPQRAGLELLQKEFGFHPLSIEDATRHYERPKLEAFAHYYFLVFYCLDYDAGRARLCSEQIGIFIGPNYIVTAHNAAIDSVDDTLRRWRGSIGDIGTGPGALLYALLDALVDDYFPVIDALAERVEDIEEGIFEHFREEALQEVFALKRDLLAVRRVIAPERDVLNTLIRREVPIFEDNAVRYFQDVYDHIVRATDSIDTYRDLLSSAQDSFLSVQSNNLNQIVKVLTITSIVLMTDALIAGIYGMNFRFMPELAWPYGYPFALGLMLILSLGLVVFFRWRKWL